MRHLGGSGDGIEADQELVAPSLGRRAELHGFAWRRVFSVRIAPHERAKCGKASAALRLLHISPALHQPLASTRHPFPAPSGLHTPSASHGLTRIRLRIYRHHVDQGQDAHWQGGCRARRILISFGAGLQLVLALRGGHERASAPTPTSALASTHGHRTIQTTHLDSATSALGKEDEQGAVDLDDALSVGEGDAAGTGAERLEVFDELVEVHNFALALALVRVLALLLL
ncbi:hypothetical protein L1887_47805 [Cichorium endivia]|nr:hypothetical protein L1887_47805 [Cichorium endivia]